MNYYNEIDPHASAWIRQLIDGELIPPGHVDTRSIADIQPKDLHGYTQCHFFAGIAGWSLAMQLAGWPATRPVWTGSCPCQPFSCAGKQLGIEDERHLWPEFARLIGQCRPATVFGEQVASKAGRDWLSGVFADLEAMGYAAAGADLCAASVGAPHIRQRLFWVADSGGQRRYRVNPLLREDEGRRNSGQVYETSGSGQDADRMADAECVRREVAIQQRGNLNTSRCLREADECGSGSPNSGLGHAIIPGLEGHPGHVHDGNQPGRLDTAADGPASTSGNPWTRFIIIQCADGKSRRIESGTPPLAHGLPRGVVQSGDPRVQETSEARVMRIRGYGNAIVPQVAAEFVAAFEDVRRLP